MEEITNCCICNDGSWEDGVFNKLIFFRIQLYFVMVVILVFM